MKTAVYIKTTATQKCKFIVERTYIVMQRINQKRFWRTSKLILVYIARWNTAYTFRNSYTVTCSPILLEYSVHDGLF